MRLITRSDFDGLVCAVLLKEVETIDAIEFVHPKDVQDGKIKVTKDDILTNLPMPRQVGLWFDHHSSEAQRNDLKKKGFAGRFEVAPSAARVVYNHYVEKGQGKKLKKYAKLLTSVDKYDAAQLTPKDVKNPTGWMLIGYVTDPRTGLGYHHDYRISNLQLMHSLVEWIGTMSLEELLQQPDVKQRTDRYFAENERFRVIQKEASRLEKNVVITDLRGRGELPAGNRFLIYTLFPKANVSVRIFDGKKGDNKVICAVGHSIFNRTCRSDVGKLMGKFGGGGHRGAGTCQLPVKKADEALKKVIASLKRVG